MSNDKIKIRVKSNCFLRGCVSGSGRYQKDSSITICAMARKGYSFMKWNDGDTKTTRQIHVVKDETFIACFEPVVRVSVKANDSNMGEVSGGGVFESGTVTTISATSKNEHSFKCWDDGNTERLRQITVSKERTYVAIFEPYVRISVKANDSNMGEVSGGGVFESGTVTTISATSKNEHSFKCWDDGNTETTRQVTAIKEKTYTALFEPVKIFNNEQFNDTMRQRLFCNLMNISPEKNYSKEPCPSQDNFCGSKDNHFIHTTNTNIVMSNTKKRTSCKHIRFWFWLIPILIILLFAALFLLPTKCYGANSDSLVTLNSNRTNIPLKISTKENCNQLIFAHRIVIDSTYSVAQDSLTSSPAGAQKTIHGEITYRNTSWQILLYCGILAILLLITFIVTLWKFIAYWEKKTEWEQKHQELQYKDNVRSSDEERDYERLQYKTELLIYEKREKAKIDEWIRDNENARKLDILEQERIAELNKLLLEMAKVKNTVTLSDPKGSGKSIVIERSILFDDCCDKMKDISNTFVSQEDCCCKLLKEMFHSLTDGMSSRDKCERIKELLKCLLCHDSDCDKKYKDLCDKIDQIMLILKQ